jgi:hypothetical protein
LGEENTLNESKLTLSMISISRIMQKQNNKKRFIQQKDQAKETADISVVRTIALVGVVGGIFPD